MNTTKFTRPAAPASLHRHQTNRIASAGWLLILALLMSLGAATSWAATVTNTLTTAGSGSWTAPAGVYWITVEAWGGGGGGGGDSANSGAGAGGGGGGAYAKLNSYAVTPGNSYTYTVGSAGTAGAAANGTGGTGGNSFFVNTSTLNAVGGTGGTGGDGGTGGAGGTAAASTGDIKFSGGAGRTSSVNDQGGGGGSSAGTTTNGISATGTTGATAVTDGGPGGAGGSDAAGSTPGSGPGGGGGGGGCSSGGGNGTDRAGGAGFAGQLRIIYVAPTTVSFTTSGNWTAPAGVTAVTVEAWGAGGGGGGDGAASGNGAGGGGGGAYAKLNSFAVTPGSSYAYTIGAGGTGGITNNGTGGTGGNTFFVNTSTVNAVGGTGGTGGDGGAGGAGGTAAASTGDVTFSGGSGRTSTLADTGGGGGGSAGTGSDGNTATGTAGATAVTGGGPGGSGGNDNNGSSPASGPGGGGGGGGNDTPARSGGAGFSGQLRITYTLPEVVTIATAGSGTWTVPPGVTEIMVETWGGGGGGGGDSTDGSGGGGGGGGGAYAKLNSFPVTPGTSYSFTVGAAGSAGANTGGTGGTGGNSFFVDTATLNAVGGAGGVGNGGAGGNGGSDTASTGDVKFSGGNGFSITSGTTGGGGGGSGGSTVNGNAATSQTGATAVVDGGPGGSGANNGNGSSPASGPGGGGGGGGRSGTGNQSGGAGFAGQIRISAKVSTAITLSDLTQTYTGSPLTPTATTVPAGLTVVWSNAPQTTAGSYGVTATIVDPVYSGSASGTFIISKAATEGVVTSASSPVLPGVNVTFTNTLSVVAPGAGTPTGTVQFLTNGVAFGGPVALSGLAAVSSATSALAHGSNTITAEYAGDANFLGVTNTLTPALLVNAPPVPRGVETTVSQGGTRTISFNLVKYNLATDADGDAIVISATGSASYGNVSSTSTNITYVNTSGASDTIDTFTYTVTDIFGASATTNISVRIESAQGYNLLQATEDSITYLGVIGAQYALEHSADLNPPWTPVVTNTAAADGRIIFNLESPSGFYRTRYVSGP